MKKALAILLVIILVMSMAACNKAQDDVTAGSGNTETTGDNSTTGSNNTTEGGNGTTEGTETTDPTGSTTEATQGTSEPTGNGATDATQGTESTQPSGTTTPPPTGATNVTEPLHTHKYTDKVTAATCTTDGYTTHTCACGESYADTKTTATGHNFGDWKTTKEPTITATGEAERKCVNCSEKETKTLGKLTENHKHSYTSKVTKAATCSTEGVKTYTCSCGDTYTESIAKTSHNYKDIVTAPTCTNGGYTTHTCTTCGTSYSDAKTNATGHAYSAVKTQNPTCTEQGYTLHECSRCKASYKDNVKPAAGHDYDVTSNTATCTTDGKKTETCYFCGDKKVTNSPAKGHGTTRTETKEATTSAAGYTRVICNDCNGILSETEIPKLVPPHTCTMTRINCKDLKDGALGWYTATYKTYTEFTILACGECGAADSTSLQFIYTTSQITDMIIEMINQERYNVYGTHEYDVVRSSNLSYAEGRAKFATEAYIRNGYLSHEGADYSENLTATSMSGNMVRLMFNRWKNSQGHYALMIDKDAKYVALATYFDASVGFIGCLVMTETDCQHMGIPGNNN